MAAERRVHNLDRGRHDRGDEPPLAGDHGADPAVRADPGRGRVPRSGSADAHPGATADGREPVSLARPDRGSHAAAAVRRDGPEFPARAGQRRSRTGDGEQRAADRGWRQQLGDRGQRARSRARSRCVSRRARHHHRMAGHIVAPRHDPSRPARSHIAGRIRRSRERDADTPRGDAPAGCLQPDRQRHRAGLALQCHSARHRAARGQCHGPTFAQAGSQHRHLFDHRRGFRPDHDDRGARRLAADQDLGTAQRRRVHRQRCRHCHQLHAAQPRTANGILSGADPGEWNRGGAGLDRVGAMMMTASSAASATARRILAMTRLRARRLVLWMEHVWQSGRGSPDQGPTIGPGEVARLLAAETALAEEAAFLAAGEASVLTAEADAATAELSADPGWRAIRTVFGLGLEEADLLALLVALELDPGLGRVIAYLHDDSRLTQPTPWLAARLAGRGPSPFATTALLTWQLAAPLDGAASTQRLMTPWQADPAVALSVFSGVWHDPAIAAAVASIPPEST